MKTHTTMGAQTLDAALRQFPRVKFLEMARDIAASHHERFDGSGYPARLAGTDIPLCGRIVTLADVYDALTSKRIYKPAFAQDVAESMIIGDSGTHFDPIIVQAFVANEDRFLSIRAKFGAVQALAAQSYLRQPATRAPAGHMPPSACGPSDCVPRNRWVSGRIRHGPQPTKLARAAGNSSDNRKTPSVRRDAKRVAIQRGSAAAMESVIEARGEGL
jgi:hypothetical protein